ncbi:MAG: YlxR family protein [Lachnospiraceae bacterium]|nr:YlxR family protein [Lachnospiraceae bacterium]
MEKMVPSRKCIGCGTVRAKNDLLRIVKTDDGSVMIDRAKRHESRGAYICPEVDCLKRAFRTKGLDRSFRMSFPKSVYEDLKKELEAIE